MHVLLETERLVLRRFTLDDVDALVALDRDPRVRRFVDDGVPVTHEAATRAVEHWLGYHDRFEHFGFWAAVERASGDFLGWFHLRPSDDDHLDAPELGYRLVARVWGRGYATEGSRALVDLAFTATSATRVVAETMVVNTPSRRVMEKCGMRLVRTFHADWPVRIPGDEHGDVEYEITRVDWQRAGACSPRGAC